MLDRPMLAFTIALALLASPSHAGVALLASPLSPAVILGNPLQIGLGISGLENGTAIAGYDIHVGFNPNLLTFRDLRFGDPVLGNQLHLDPSSPHPVSAVSETSGRLHLLELSLSASSDLNEHQADAFLLATLTFDTLANGRSAVTLAINDLTDPAGQELMATAKSAAFAIVPLPGASILLPSGLWPWLVVARRRLTAHPLGSVHL